MKTVKSIILFILIIFMSVGMVPTLSADTIDSYIIKSGLNYDEVYGFNEGKSVVGKNYKYGFIDKTGNQIVPPVYDQARSFQEGLALVKKEGKYGFIDSTGKEVIPLVYDQADVFYEGIAMVKIGEKYGFINITGKEVVPLIYDYAHNYSEGYAVVTKDNNKMVIDKSGEKVFDIDSDCEGVSDFHDGLLKLYNGDYYYFVDTTGDTVFNAPIGGDIDNFYDGYAMIKGMPNSGAYWGPDYYLTGGFTYVDKNGDAFELENYAFAENFSEGMALVGRDIAHNFGIKYGFIDKTGKIVVTCKYDYSNGYYEGMAMVRKESKYGFIDKTGEEVIPLIYEHAESFSEGLAVVEKFGKSGYIDKTGRIIIPCNFYRASSFSEDIAVVDTSNGKAIISNPLNGKKEVPASQTTMLQSTLNFVCWSHTDIGNQIEYTVTNKTKNIDLGMYCLIYLRADNSPLSIHFIDYKLKPGEIKVGNVYIGNSIEMDDKYIFVRINNAKEKQKILNGLKCDMTYSQYYGSTQYGGEDYPCGGFSDNYYSDEYIAKESAVKQWIKDNYSN